MPVLSYRFGGGPTYRPVVPRRPNAPLWRGPPGFFATSRRLLEVAKKRPSPPSPSPLTALQLYNVRCVRVAQRCIVPNDQKLCNCHHHRPSLSQVTYGTGHGVRGVDGNINGAQGRTLADDSADSQANEARRRWCEDSGRTRVRVARRPCRSHGLHSLLRRKPERRIAGTSSRNSWLRRMEVERILY